LEPSSVGAFLNEGGLDLWDETFELLHLVAHPEKQMRFTVMVGHTYLRAGHTAIVAPVLDHSAGISARSMFAWDYTRHAISSGIVYGIGFAASPEHVRALETRDRVWKPQVTHKGNSILVEGDVLGCTAYCSRVLRDAVGSLYEFGATIFPHELARQLLTNANVAYLAVYSGATQPLASREDFAVGGVQLDAPFGVADLYSTALRDNERIRLDDGRVYRFEAERKQLVPDSRKGLVLRSGSRYLFQCLLPPESRL
jgi:hypothetical protein